MKITRRNAIQTLMALPVGFMGLSSIGGALAARAEPASKSAGSLKLSIAGYDFDRIAALADGRVTVEGCDVTFTADTIGSMNTAAFTGTNKYDVTEIGLHPFILAYVNDNFRDFTLLPIFPLRVFRHKSIFIRTDRGIDSPEDLRGKKIATPGYSSTSLTWIRGILQSEYGVAPDQVNWVVSAADSSAEIAGAASKQENVIPNNVKITKGPAGKDESDLLADGDVDALFHAAEPRCYIEGNPKVGRLFPNFRVFEQAYFKKTGIFPIMHAVAVRKSLLDEHPWLAKSIFAAYSQAKEANYKYLDSKAWAYNSLPWVAQEIENTQKLMGKNFWPYGFEVNKKALDTLCEYSFEQGLSQKRVKVEELFYPKSIELTEEIKG